MNHLKYFLEHLQWSKFIVLLRMELVQFFNLLNIIGLEVSWSQDNCCFLCQAKSFKNFLIYRQYDTLIFLFRVELIQCLNLLELLWLGSSWRQGQAESSQNFFRTLDSGPEYLKKSRPKKLVKSNKLISRKNFFCPNSIFWNFKNGQKSIFELGKSLKLPKMQFH